MISGFLPPMGKYLNLMHKRIVLLSYKILTEQEIAASVHLVNILDAGSYGLIISTDFGGLRRFDPGTGKVTNLFERRQNYGKMFGYGQPICTIRMKYG